MSAVLATPLPFRPPAPPQPEGPINPLRLLHGLWTNPIATWTRQNFDLPIVESNGVLGRLIVVNDPPAIKRILVDNVEIPNINAFANFASAGGTVSLLDAELLQDVTFLTGGYPAPYVNRTSSVMQVALQGDEGGVKAAVNGAVNEVQS